MIGVLVKINVCVILVRVVVSVHCACKIDKYLDLKNCSCEKLKFDKLPLAWKNKILNTTETSLDIKKLTYEENNCLIYRMLLVIISLLLLFVIFINCYYYYTRHYMKKE